MFFKWKPVYIFVNLNVFLNLNGSTKLQLECFEAYVHLPNYHAI